MASFNEMTTPVKRLVKLYVESARLNVVEKLTRFLTGVAIALICTLFVIICLAFVSFGIVVELKTVVPSYAAYLIVGGFYLLLIAGLIIFKRTLLLNPIARFLSKLILDPPAESCRNAEQETQPTNNDEHE